MTRPGNDNQNANQLPLAKKGERFGEFVLDSRVGVGTFGEVWKARHHVWQDELVAVKLPTDPQYLRALRREGITAHHLDHPAIVRPIGFDPFSKRPYLVMEFVDGDDLRTYLKRNGPLSAAETVDIMTRVLQGLAYAHDRGVIHRDIKPENVLLHHSWQFDPAAASVAGLVKITDFGLGKAENAAIAGVGKGSILFSNEVAQGNVPSIVGTLDYMAPEQRGGGDVDGRADLYACGVMLFEMLIGDRPAGTDLPSDLRKDVPPHLDEVFRRSYTRVDRRFPSAMDMLAALSRANVASPGREFHPDGLSFSSNSGEFWTGQGSDRQPHKLKLVRDCNCPDCGGDIAGDDQFCMHCGKQLVPAVVRCGRCGAFPSPTDKFCMFCGHDIRPRTNLQA